jgi:hypothetical protein
VVVPSADVELALLLAKCSSCDAVFSFAGHVGRSEDQAVEAALGAPPPSFRQSPSSLGVNESEGDGGLELSYRWFRFQHLFLAFFAVFWNGFLVVWYVAVAGMAMEGNSLEVAPFALFPLIHVTVGLGVGYTALTGLVNSTTLAVNQAGLSVRHGPLPWRGNVDFASSDLEQLFLTRRVSNSKNGSTVVFDLKAISAGKTVVLIKGVATENTARYLEHKVEAFLGIANQPVAGEHL